MNGTAVGFVITVSAYTSSTSVDIHSDSTVSATANFAISQSSSISAVSSLTASATRIIQYEGQTISGVSVTTQPFRYVDDALNTTVNANMGVGSVINIWARKTNTTAQTGSLIYFGTGVINYLAVSYINQTTFMLDGSAFGGVLNIGGLRWTNSMANDTDWHHYLIIIRDRYLPPGAGTTRVRAQLFVDGVNRGLANVESSQDKDLTSPIFLATSYSTDDVPTLPYSTISQFEGDMAQLWIGRFADHTKIDPTLFYNSGYVDFGSTGNLDGLLPTPYAYASMDEPYSNKLIPTSGYSINPATVPLPAPDIQARFTCSTSAQTVQIVSVNTTAVSSLTAQLTGLSVAQANITAVSTVTAIALSNKPFASALSSSTQLTVSAGATQKFSANLNSTTTLSADGVVESGAFANLSSTVSVTANAGRLLVSTSTISSAFTLQVNYIRIKTALLAVDSNCAVSANAVKTARAQFNQASTAALNVTVDKIRAIRADLLSDFGLGATARKTVRVISSQSAQFTQTAAARKRVGVSANFTAFYTQLTVGRVISLDPNLTYVIPAETRLYQIHKESRLWTIEGETRTIKIAKETRLYTVETDSTIYKIRGY
jgi:hypothetical protein